MFDRLLRILFKSNFERRFSFMDQIEGFLLKLAYAKGISSQGKWAVVQALLEAQTSELSSYKSLKSQKLFVIEKNFKKVGGKSIKILRSLKQLSHSLLVLTRAIPRNFFILRHHRFFYFILVIFLY